MFRLRRRYTILAASTSYRLFGLRTIIHLPVTKCLNILTLLVGSVVLFWFPVCGFVALGAMAKKKMEQQQQKLRKGETVVLKFINLETDDLMHLVRLV